jgi:hypothetical protein
MESEQRSTEAEVTMHVGVMVLELSGKQQDQFFMKIEDIDVEDQMDMGIVIDCCGDPVFAEISVARFEDDESDIIQIYHMNYIDIDDYLDYVKEKRYL